MEKMKEGGGREKERVGEGLREKDSSRHSPLLLDLCEG
jgi:hypothetical protein